MRERVQVVALADDPRLVDDFPGPALRLEFQRRLRAVLARTDLGAVDVGVDAAAVRDVDAHRLDLLHELLLEGVDGVEPVDEVADGLVRRGVAQDHQGPEERQHVVRRPALHLLRFVEDEDGPVRGDHVDGSAASELVQLHVDAPRVLAASVERLDVHHHHLDVGVRREVQHVLRMRGVVDVDLRRLAVVGGELVRRDLEGLLHALADGDAGHDDDELAPSVAPVQLEDRLCVDERLARPRLHLDLEFGESRIDVCPLQVLPVLDGVKMVREHVRRQGDRRVRVADVGDVPEVQRLLDDAPVAHAGKDALRRNGDASGARVAGVDRVDVRVRVGLAVEDVADRVRRVLLEGLVLELEFHFVVAASVPGLVADSRSAASTTASKYPSASTAGESRPE